MATGTITTIRPGRGFGFIAQDGGGADLFFHQTAVIGADFSALREGQCVSDEEGPDPRNPDRQRATNVRPVTESEAKQRPQL
jgi:CspA family cold shock protein